MRKILLLLIVCGLVLPSATVNANGLYDVDCPSSMMDGMQGCDDSMNCHGDAEGETSNNSNNYDCSDMCIDHCFTSSFSALLPLYLDNTGSGNKNVKISVSAIEYDSIFSDLINYPPITLS